MNGEMVKFIVDALQNSKVDNLNRARMPFAGLNHLQIQQEHEESGQTRAQIVAGYEHRDKQYDEAIAWVVEKGKSTESELISFPISIRQAVISLGVNRTTLGVLIATHNIPTTSGKDGRSKFLDRDSYSQLAIVAKPFQLQERQS